MRGIGGRSIKPSDIWRSSAGKLREISSPSSLVLARAFSKTVCPWRTFQLYRPLAFGVTLATGLKSADRAPWFCNKKRREPKTARTDSLIGVGNELQIDAEGEVYAWVARIAKVIDAIDLDHIDVLRV